jgi:protein-disulfide isomerase-like protein with CxxC motif
MQLMMASAVIVFHFAGGFVLDRKPAVRLVLSASSDRSGCPAVRPLAFLRSPQTLRAAYDGGRRSLAAEVLHEYRFSAKGRSSQKLLRVPAEAKSMTARNRCRSTRHRDLAANGFQKLGDSSASL